MPAELCSTKRTLKYLTLQNINEHGTIAKLTGVTVWENSGLKMWAGSTWSAFLATAGLSLGGSLGAEKDITVPQSKFRSEYNILFI